MAAASIIYTQNTNIQFNTQDDIDLRKILKENPIANSVHLIFVSQNLSYDMYALETFLMNRNWKNITIENLSVDINTVHKIIDVFKKCKIKSSISFKFNKEAQINDFNINILEEILIKNGRENPNFIIKFENTKFNRLEIEKYIKKIIEPKKMLLECEKLQIQEIDKNDKKLIEIFNKYFPKNGILLIAQTNEKSNNHDKFDSSLKDSFWHNRRMPEAVKSIFYEEKRDDKSVQLFTRANNTKEDIYDALNRMNDVCKLRLTSPKQGKIFFTKRDKGPCRNPKCRVKDCLKVANTANVELKLGDVDIRVNRIVDEEREMKRDISLKTGMSVEGATAAAATAGSAAAAVELQTIEIETREALQKNVEELAKQRTPDLTLRQVIPFVSIVDNPLESLFWTVAEYGANT